MHTTLCASDSETKATFEKCKKDFDLDIDDDINCYTVLDYLVDDDCICAAWERVHILYLIKLLWGYIKISTDRLSTGPF